MEAVGLFEAKTHLSEYVARAEAGEEVIIMRHNKPVAKIVPIDAGGNGPRFDAARRRAALQACIKAKEQWRRAHGPQAPGLSAELVRDMRDRGAQD